MNIKELFICFFQDGAPSGGGGAESLGIGPGEGRIASEAGPEAAVGCAHAAADHIPGHQQPSVRQIIVDGLACFSAEQAHHVVFADIKLSGQVVDGQILGQMTVDIAQNILDPAVFRRNGIGERAGRVLLPADFHQKVQQQAVAQNLLSVVFCG